MTARHAGAAVLLCAGVLTACPARPSGSATTDDAPTVAQLPAAGAPPACEFRGGLLPAGASMDGRDGRYALELQSTSGPRAGASTRAILQLERASRAAAGHVAYPLVGTTDLRVAELGGSIPGDASSRDPMRPGVLVLEYPRAGAPAAARDVTLRLGSDANGAALADQRFDGAYMALHVRQIDAGGFAGQWSSGEEGRSAGGHFCARRIAER